MVSAKVRFNFFNLIMFYTSCIFVYVRKFETFKSCLKFFVFFFIFYFNQDTELLSALERVIEASQCNWYVHQISLLTFYVLLF